MRLLITTSIFLLLVIVACEPVVPIKQSTPKEAVQGFLAAFKAEDFDLVAHYVSDASKESFQHFRTNLNMISEEEKKTLLEGYKVTVKQIDCLEEQGKTFCKLSYQPEGEGVLKLVQQEQKWFIQIDFDY